MIIGVGNSQFYTDVWGYNREVPTAVGTNLACATLVPLFVDNSLIKTPAALSSGVVFRDFLTSQRGRHVDVQVRGPKAHEVDPD